MCCQVPAGVDARAGPGSRASPIETATSAIHRAVRIPPLNQARGTGRRDRGVTPTIHDVRVTLPPALEAAFALEDPQAVLDALMIAYTEALDAHRCFIYVRDPVSGTGSVVSSWSASPEWDDKHRPWAVEPDDLFTFDPLMGIASRTPVAVFIEDVEAEGPDVVNIEFERRDYKHTAFVHAPVYFEGQLVGILEPCTFGPPRVWTPGDRELTAAVQERLGPVVGPWVREQALAFLG
jgi:hypothetical protein